MDLCDPSDMPVNGLERRLEGARSALLGLAKAIVDGEDGEVRQATLWPMHDAVDENLEPIPGDGQPTFLGVFLGFPGGGVIGFRAEPADHSREGLMRCELIAVVAVIGALAERFIDDGDDEENNEDPEDSGESASTASTSWGVPVGRA